MLALSTDKPDTWTMSKPDIVVERLETYSEADAAGIGRLMPFLSERLNNEPMAEDVLRAIVESPHHDQLVAKLDGLIVGAATMNLLMGPGVNKQGYLEDFVTDPKYRGQGIGDRVWQAMIDWCKEQEVDLSFTSNPSREEAHRFYLNHGAEIRDTNAFHMSVE